MFLTRKIIKFRDIVFHLKNKKYSAFVEYFGSDYPIINKKFTYELDSFYNNILIKYKDIKIVKISYNSEDWKGGVIFPRKMIKELEKEVEELLNICKKIDRENLTKTEKKAKEEQELLDNDFK